MFGHLTYVYWLILWMGLPLMALGCWQARILWRHRRALGLSLLGAAVGGWAWDVLAVRLGAWYYHDANITDIWIGGLPLEEWLWIVGVTLLFGAVTIVVLEQQALPVRVVQRSAREHAQIVLWPLLAWQALALAHFSQLAMLLIAGVIFHGMLWARNAPFLWAQRRVILLVVAIAEAWMLISDPIGSAWGAWFYDPGRVLGVWLFGLIPVEDLFGIALVSSAAACAILVFGHGPRRWI